MVGSGSLENDRVRLNARGARTVAVWKSWRVGIPEEDAGAGHPDDLSVRLVVDP